VISHFDLGSACNQYERFSKEEVKFITHPWICYGAWCLHQDNALNELDTAHFDSCGLFVHTSEDIGFDGGQSLPCLTVGGMENTKQNEKA